MQAAARSAFMRAAATRQGEERQEPCVTQRCNYSQILVVFLLLYILGGDRRRLLPRSTPEELRCSHDSAAAEFYRVRFNVRASTRALV